MSKILCSTGALIGRPNNRDYRLLKELSGKLSCDGFEFMMYSTWYPEKERLVDALLSYGLFIPVIHCDKLLGESFALGEASEEYNNAVSLFETNCIIGKALGAKKAVLHLWNGLISDKHIENNMKAYSVLAQIAKNYSLTLLIENVVCSGKDPFFHWTSLKEMYPDISFIFDTKMAAFHGQLDLLYSEEYSWLTEEKHILHYHVNDYGGGYKDWKNLRTLPIGQGSIDFERFFRFVNSKGYNDTFTVESTAFDETGKVDTEMLNRQFDLLRASLN